MSMLSPVYAEPERYLYPFENTPATSLSQDLPPGMRANCLLLGWGDLRGILFTIFREEREETKEDSGTFVVQRG